jgi:hypothetical protein
MSILPADDWMMTRDLPVDIIKVGARQLPLDESTVKRLMISIPTVGLLHPIIVNSYQSGKKIEVHLVTGLNRLEAHRRLGTTKVITSGSKLRSAGRPGRWPAIAMCSTSRRFASRG